METYSLIPLLTAIVVGAAVEVGVMVSIIASVMINLNRKSVEHHKETQSFIRHMHVENRQDRKESRRILDEIQKTNQELKQINKDNAVFLHRIFEIVDAPEEDKS